jgi:hypothetical protein
MGQEQTTPAYPRRSPLVPTTDKLMVGPLCRLRAKTERPEGYQWPFLVDRRSTPDLERAGTIHDRTAPSPSSRLIRF